MFVLCTQGGITIALKCLSGPIGCIIAGLAILYIISPIDLMPDFIPIVGWIDDIVAAIVGLGALVPTIFGGFGNIFDGFGNLFGGKKT
jgi:hypothetical protein